MQHAAEPPQFHIIGLDVRPPKTALAGTDFIACDLTNNSSVADAMWQVRDQHGQRIASTIHLAAYYDFGGEPSPMYEMLTVQGTRRLLQQLLSLKVEQFVFSSSLLVMRPAAEGDQTNGLAVPDDG